MSKAVTTAPGTNAYIGNRADGLRGFDGEIDELGIWSRELTGAEIAELYNSGNGKAFVNRVAANNVPVLLRVSDDDELRLTCRHDGRDIRVYDADGNQLPAKVGIDHTLQQGPLGKSWFAHPYCARFVGTHDRTYFTWASMESGNGGWWIGYYDHNTGAKASAQLNSALTVDVDEHMAPCIAIDPATGTLYVIANNTPGGTACRLFVSDSPEDISSFTEVTLDSLSSNFSYPKLLFLPDGTLFLTYRIGIGSTNRQNVFRTATTADVSASGWSSQNPFWYDGTGKYSYLQIDSHPTLNQVYAISTPNHPDLASPEENDIGMMYWDKATASFYQVDGTLIGAVGAVTPSVALATLVEDASDAGYNFWPGRMQVGSDGTPYALYSEHRSSLDLRWRWAKWNGSSFDCSEVAATGETLYGNGAAEPNYIPGADFAGDNPNVVYYSKDVGNGVLALCRGVTNDDGQTWVETQLTSGNSASIQRPSAVYNAHPECKCLYVTGEYTTFVDSNGSYAAWPGPGTRMNTDLLLLVELDFDGDNDVEFYLAWGDGKNISEVSPLSDAFLAALGDTAIRTIQPATTALDGQAITAITAFRRDNAGSSHLLLADWTSGTDRHFLMSVRAENELRAAVDDSGGTTREANFSDLPITTGRYVGGFRYDGTLSGFLDGVKSATTASGTSTLRTASAAQVIMSGAWPASDSNSLNGLIDLQIIYLAAKSNDFMQLATTHLAGDTAEAGETVYYPAAGNRLIGGQLVGFPIVGQQIVGGPLIGVAG